MDLVDNQERRHHKHSKHSKHSRHSHSKSKHKHRKHHHHHHHHKKSHGKHHKHRSKLKINEQALQSALESLEVNALDSIRMEVNQDLHSESVELLVGGSGPGKEKEMGGGVGGSEDSDSSSSESDPEGEVTGTLSEEGIVNCDASTIEESTILAVNAKTDSSSSIPLVQEVESIVSAPINLSENLAEDRIQSESDRKDSESEQEEMISSNEVFSSLKLKKNVKTIQINIQRKSLVSDAKGTEEPRSDLGSPKEEDGETVTVTSGDAKVTYVNLKSKKSIKGQIADSQVSDGDGVPFQKSGSDLEEEFSSANEESEIERGRQKSKGHSSRKPYQRSRSSSPGSQPRSFSHHRHRHGHSKSRSRSRSPQRSHRHGRSRQNSHSHRRYGRSSSRSRYIRSRSRSRSPQRSHRHRRSRSRSRSRSPQRSHRHRSRSRSRSPQRSHRHRRSRSRSRSRSPQRSHRCRGRSQSRSPQRSHKHRKSRSRSHSGSRSPGRSYRKGRSGSRSRSCSPERLHGRSRSRSRRRYSLRSRDRYSEYHRRRYSHCYSPKRYHSPRRSSRRRSYHRSRSGSSSRHRRKYHSRARSYSRGSSHSHSDDDSSRSRSQSRASSRDRDSRTLAAPGTGSVVATVSAAGASDPKQAHIAQLTALCKHLQEKQATEDELPEEELKAMEERGDTEEVQIRAPFDVTPTPVYQPGLIFHNNVWKTPNQLVAESNAGTVSRPVEAQYPVSTGLDHQITEGAADAQSAAQSINVFARFQSVSVGDLVVKRLEATRKLQENPSDFTAQQTLAYIEQKAKVWAESHMKPGQFTGQRALTALSRQDHKMGMQAWAKKKMFHGLAPVMSSFGMKMLKKMGWQEGQPLGMMGEGHVEPIAVDVKVDRSGLSTEMDKQPQVVLAAALQSTNSRSSHLVHGKHPVSVLQEICAKKRWDPPHYELLEMGGPAHKKSFLYKITVPLGTFQPAVASPSKKQAKAQAATACLQGLGFSIDSPITYTAS